MALDQLAMLLALVVILGAVIVALSDDETNRFV